MSTRRRSHVVATVVALAALAGACTTERSEAPPSLVPLVPPDALPVSTVATSTTVASSSDPNAPLLVAPPDTECGYSDPVPAGEITFVVGDRLLFVADTKLQGAQPDGTLTALPAGRSGHRLLELSVAPAR